MFLKLIILYLTIWQYIYEVYEQLSSTNEDTTGLNLVENGRMILKAVGETTNYLTGYSPQTQFV
jgi:hypothetical protein